MHTSEFAHVDEPLDEMAFQAALTYLIGEAYEQGIDVDGEWICATQTSLPDREVSISEIS